MPEVDTNDPITGFIFKALHFGAEIVSLPFALFEMNSQMGDDVAPSSYGANGANVSEGHSGQTNDAPLAGWVIGSMLAVAIVSLGVAVV